MEQGASSAVLRVILYWFLSTPAFAEETDTVPILRISNGEYTERDEFPFMTALGWINNATGDVDFLGGGMLIAPNFVLTAAHCVFLRGRLSDIVTIGGESVNSTFNEIHKVKNFFIFPDYDDKQAYYDIALLELEENSG